MARKKKDEGEQAVMGSLPADGKVYLLAVREKNVKIIRALDIDDVGEVHYIKGDADNGKTSALDGIKAAIHSCPGAMVRQGADAMEVILELSAGVLTRMIDREGATSVNMTDPDGLPVEAVDFLRAVFGRQVFDPLAWADLGGGENMGRTARLREQRAQLLSALPVTFDRAELKDAVREKGSMFWDAIKQINMDKVGWDQHPANVFQTIEEIVFERRALENRMVEEAENALKRLPESQRPAPAAKLVEVQASAQKAAEAYYTAKASSQNTANLQAQMARLRDEVERENKELPPREKVAQTRAKYAADQATAADEEAAAAARVIELKAALSKAETLLKETVERGGEASEKVRKGDALLRRWETQDARKKDLANIEAQVGEGQVFDLVKLEREKELAEADVVARKLQDDIEAAAGKLTAAKAKADVLTVLVELFRDELPKLLLSKAELPVPGLSIDKDQVLVGGIPLHQMGTAKRIEVGVVVASALNPRSGFMLIDRAESLGREGLLALKAAAKAVKVQLIMSWVDPDAEPGKDVTVMKDGAAVRAAA